MTALNAGSNVVAQGDSKSKVAVKKKDIYTTGEVATICSVAPRTVSNWFDSGLLAGYRIPGSKDRRIPHNQLIKFMHKHQIPISNIVGVDARPCVLFVGNKIAMDIVRESLTIKNQPFQYMMTYSWFDAGYQLSAFKPDLMVIDLNRMEHANLVEVIMLARNREKKVRVIVVKDNPDDGVHVPGAPVGTLNFDGVLKRYYGIDKLVELIDKLS